jgi:hypothetical protein
MLKRGRLGRLVVPLMGGGLQYWQKVRNVQAAKLIALWRLRESSGSVAADSSGHGYNGAYTGVDLAYYTGIGGDKAPYFDGVNDFVNIYSVGLAAAFDSQEGSAIVWGKVSAAGIWTDGQAHSLFALGVDGTNNFIGLDKSTANNTVRGYYKAGGTSSSASGTGLGGQTGNIILGITWSKSADKVIFYGNGSQIDTTKTGLGVWAGALDSTLCSIGARNITPAQVWSGMVSLCALWSVALTPAEMLNLSKV